MKIVVKISAGTMRSKERLSSIKNRCRESANGAPAGVSGMPKENVDSVSNLVHDISQFNNLMIRGQNAGRP